MTDTEIIQLFNETVNLPDIGKITGTDRKVLYAYRGKQVPSIATMIAFLRKAGKIEVIRK